MIGGYQSFIIEYMTSKTATMITVTCWRRFASKVQEISDCSFPPLTLDLQQISDIICQLNWELE